MYTKSTYCSLNDAAWLSSSKRGKRSSTCLPLGAVINHSQSALAAYSSVDAEPSVND